MKKLLLVISLVSVAAASATAQCTPDVTLPAPNYADSTFGAWPDTVENFGPAAVGVAYVQDLQFKVPLDAGDVDAALAGNTIQDFTVDAVNGLPAGLSYACNIPSCTFAGGSVGCAQITGTCSAAGTYDITIDVTGTILVFGFPVPAPYTFSGYKIVVGTAGIVEAIINPITLHPNPANDKITLTGLNSQMKITSAVITNMEGKVVKTLDITAATMDVNLNGMDNGVYFVVVNHAGGTETLKFIKE
jgi:hypothetical protein